MAKKRKSRAAGRQPPKKQSQFRSRRRVVLFAGVVVAITAAAWSGWRATRGPRRDFANVLASGSAAGFNVVVVTLDTTRADRLGCYGHQRAETPVLDRLAAEGIRFDDAVACVPLTLPAHASIFTGLDPPNHGVRNNGEYRLDSSRITLAEVLQDQGYATAALVSAFVLDARFGLNQGFAYYDDEVETTRKPRFGTAESQRSAEAVTDASIRWLGGRPTEMPFFLWTHYYDPHDPYRPPTPYAARFRANPYDGEIAYMDAQIGRLVQALEDAALEDRTLMIVVGDHGESLGEYHEGTHGRLIYEATQHVPLIVWCPGLIRGPYVVDDVVVATVDVFPTVLDLLGLAPQGSGDGVSLLRARQDRDRTVYLETMMPYLENGWAPLHGLRRHLDKYILAPRPEYYDVQADPHELTNLYGTAGRPAPAACGELSAALADLMKDSPSPAAVAASALEVDAEALRRLQSLGYLSGSGPSEAGQLLDPKDMMPTRELFLAAKAASRSGRFDEALTKLVRALEHSPKDPSVLRELGTTYLQMNRFQKAEDVFLRHIEIKPKADIFMLLGQIMMREGQLEKAAEYLDQGLTIEPDCGAVLVAKGDLMAMLGRTTEALRWYERAKQIDPYRATGLANHRIARARGQQD